MQSKTRQRFKYISAGWIVTYAFMIALVCFTALPLVYMVCSAFKPLSELFIYPPRFFVQNPTLKNIKDLFSSMDSSVVPFSRYLFNSVFCTTATVVGTVYISSTGAYALTKLHIKGKNLIFSLILAALMFAPQVTQIPNYMVVNSLGMINQYSALIIPKIASAYSIFLMKQYMQEVPDTLLEAARIDGAGEWRIFGSIIMPMVKPAWATLVVLTFISNWNDYFTPLIFIQKQAMKTLPLALQSLAGTAGSITRSGVVAAAVFLTTLPVIVIYLCMQAKVMKTMAFSGIK